MKYFFRGLIISGMALLLLPIAFPLVFVDLILIMGGKDPFDTPAYRLFNKALGRLLQV